MKSLFASVLLSFAAAALTDDDVAAVFPNSRSDLASLTSTTVRFREYDISLVANTTHVLISLNKTDTSYSSIGWLGHGVGTSMSNGDLYAIWPNSDDTWTISHRQPAAHVEPTPITSSEGLVTLVPALTTNSTSLTSWTAVSFIRPLSFAGVTSYGTTSSNVVLAQASGQRLLYTYGDRNPGSTDPTAELDEHNDQGTGSADLSRAYVPTTSSGSDGSSDGGSSSGGSGGGGSSSGGSGSSPNEPQVVTAGWNKYNRLVVAHAVFASVAVMILSPTAILIGRYFRNKKWFPIHRALQFGYGTFIIIAFSLAVAAVNESNGEFWDDTHHRLGLFVFILTLVQILIGSLAHRTKLEPGTSRGIVRWAHVVLGITVAVIGYAEVYLGFDEWEDKGSQGMKPPKGVRIVFWILLGVEVAAYFIGVVLFPRSFIGRPKAQDAAIHNKEGTSSSFV